MQPIGEFVLGAVADACNLERSGMRETMALADIGFDSLSAASFTFLVESSYGIELKEDDVVALYEAQTVKDVIALTERLVPS